MLDLFYTKISKKDLDVLDRLPFNFCNCLVHQIVVRYGLTFKKLHKAIPLVQDIIEMTGNMGREKHKELNADMKYPYINVGHLFNFSK